MNAYAAYLALVKQADGESLDPVTSGLLGASGVSLATGYGGVASGRYMGAERNAIMDRATRGMNRADRLTGLQRQARGYARINAVVNPPLERLNRNIFKAGIVAVPAGLAAMGFGVAGAISAHRNAKAITES